MSTEATSGSPVEIYRRWLVGLKTRDSALYAELMVRIAMTGDDLKRRMTPESTADGLTRESPSDEKVEEFVYETIVRAGRPALLVQDNAIQFSGTENDQASKEVIDRLKAMREKIEPLLPLVGRIDSPNNAGNLPFLGTGWLVDRNIVVTNRHVAEIMARQDGRSFVFKPGRFGEKLEVSVDYRREHGLSNLAVAAVKRVLWIEPDSRKADIAFIEVGAADDALERGWIDLAANDAQDADEVAVIGYPARAPAYIIPDQSRMDRIYGGTYEIKRVAPGLMGSTSRGWATHDCTTLGGNSGSVVVSSATGKAVALHFAGLYMIENYAVPASTIRSYLEKRPWVSGSSQAPAAPPKESAILNVTLGEGGRPMTMDLNIPLQIQFTVGTPEMRGSNATVSGVASRKSNADTAAQDLARELSHVDGVVAVRSGALTEGGRLTATPGLIVSVHPAWLRDPSLGIPASYGDFMVETQAASISDQLGMTGIAVAEGVSSIAYDDEARSGPDYSFNWVSESMEVKVHVGPERSWPVLKTFLAEAQSRLVSSIYEFHAAHIAEGVNEKLDEGVDMKLVLARQSRNPKGVIAAGDFDREVTFSEWREAHPSTFENVYVPLGGSGLVANSYHIKVTVRDDDDVWLSSGNWKRASQPLIPVADLDDPRKTSKAGNREWHVVLKNKTLADRFRNHILADLRRSVELGGTEEAVGGETMIDVPLAALEMVELEAAASQVFEPLDIGPRKVRVKPLLTPDRKGKVFTDAVLSLIESAEHQLVLQNQYIKAASAQSNLKTLLQALCEKSKVLEDFRILLRSGGDGFTDDMRALQKGGMDVHRCVRKITNTHTKGIVVDGSRVLVGSHNWSSDGVSLNRDASLIFDDREIAGYFLGVFEEDWNRAPELSLADMTPEAAPVVATGPRPPEGYVRMTLSEYLDR